MAVIAIPMRSQKADMQDILIIDPRDIKAVNVEATEVDQNGNVEYETYIMFTNGDRYETDLELKELLQLIGWTEIDDPESCLEGYV